MKNTLIKRLFAMTLAISMIAAMSVTVGAAKTEEEKAIEAISQWLNGATFTPRTGNDAPSTPSGNTVSPPQTLTADELKAYADAVFDIVNEEREKAGVSPLRRDTLLDEAATIRAAEIIVVDIAGGIPHTRPDGSSYRDLLDEMGVNGIRCGENISRANATPQAAMQTWMKSDGHRRNILRENYGSIGIGVYQRANGLLDWVQIFELS